MAKLADVIVPEVFNPYVLKKTTELDAFIQAGIVATSPELQRRVDAGGAFINMPYWNDLEGDDEVHVDTGDLTPQKFTSGKDIAVVIGRAKSWYVTDLAKELAGSDPMADIGDKVARFWSRMRQKALINTLTGAFGAASMSTNVKDISGETGAAAVISQNTTVDAAQLLGDHKENLSGIVMHSAVEAKLAKDQAIVYIQEAGVSDRVRTYMGKRVIVDDNMPNSAGVYTTYLFGQGAIGYAPAPVEAPVEVARDALGSGGQDVLVVRNHYIQHPRGIKWNVTTQTPSNAQLATGTNWLKVYNTKDIRIVQFKHKIA